MVRFKLYEPSMSLFNSRIDKTHCRAAVEKWYKTRVPGADGCHTNQCSRKSGEDGLCGIHRNLKARA